MNIYEDVQYLTNNPRSPDSPGADSGIVSGVDSVGGRDPAKAGEP
jgi:hypothetical protein